MAKPLSSTISTKQSTSVTTIMDEVEKIAYIYGDVCLRKQRRKRRKLIISELLLDYAKNSTLHGLRYIAEKGLTTFEKLFWITTFIISIAFCSYLIKNVYVKWQVSPVIVTFSERLVSVREIPFPSVTICPQLKSKASVYNYTNKIQKKLRSGYEDKHMFAGVSIICDNNALFNFGGRMYTNASIVGIIDKVSPTSSDVFFGCKWKNITHHCNDLFKKVYTAEGLCFNMNGLAAEEMIRNTVQSDYKYSERDIPTTGWSLEDGYTAKIENPFPSRGSENGPYPDLEVILQRHINDSDGLCNGLNSGYKIYIQHPTDFPQSSMYYYAALDGQVSSLAISLDILSTDRKLHEYSIQTRQCFFPEEHPLRYFKFYTAKNCRAECLSNYTFEGCGCVGYYMPHNNSSQICAAAKRPCMEDAHHYMAETELKLEISKSDEGCRCLPSCNSVEYDAEILKTEFRFRNFIEKLKLLLESNGLKVDFTDYKFSKIDMYFKKPRFVSMRRSELFGLTDFLANIGGLLGVFLGFSFLSLIEILYFVTVRVGCSLRHDLREEKKNRDSVKVVKVKK